MSKTLPNMETDDKMHVQTPDSSSHPLKDNSNVIRIDSNANSAILLKRIYIYAHSSCGISGMKAGLYEILSSTCRPLRIWSCGENAEAPIQWLDASFCERFRNSLFTWHTLHVAGGANTIPNRRSEIRYKTSWVGVFIGGKKCTNFRPWRGSNSSAQKVHEKPCICASRSTYVPSATCAFEGVFGLGCCPCY